eukprot:10881213-Karenia_brevis.AAC.1
MERRGACDALRHARGMRCHPARREGRVEEGVGKEARFAMPSGTQGLGGSDAIRHAGRAGQREDKGRTWDAKDGGCNAIPQGGQGRGIRRPLDR